MNETTQNGQIIGDQDPSVDESMYDDLGGGIASSFPVLSYRSSRWRVRWQGVEELLVDAQNRPVEEIGVCLVRVPNHKSKRYWIEGYKNDSRPPDCWSNDAVRPHPSLTPPVQMQGWPNPRPTTCAECCWDQFNTSPRQDGSVGRGKACADYKRMVVKIYFPQMPIGFEAAAGQLFLMQVPPDSLQAIKKYGEELARERLAAAATVTFVGLVINDQKISYPKLTFRKGPKLSSDELEVIKYARMSDDATRILNEEIAFTDPDAIAYEGPSEEQQDTVQPEVVQSIVVQAPTRPAAPAQARPATGMPPRPQAPAQSTPGPRLQQAPSARAIPPQPQARAPAPPINSMSPQASPRQGLAQIGPTQTKSVNPISTRQPGGISTAVARPATPPPSNRNVIATPNRGQQPVRPTLAPPPQSEKEYGTAGEVEDELDKSFGDLAARGIIEQ